MRRQAAATTDTGAAVKADEHPGVGGTTSAEDTDRAWAIVIPSRRIGYERPERWPERTEDLHDLPMALSAQRAPRVIEISVGPVGGGRGWRRRAEEVLRRSDRGAPLAIGEQPEMADAHEAAREHVQQKAPEEFLDAQRHGFRAPAIGIVLPAETERAFELRLRGQEASVRW